ncbi:MAG TPA: hypothetical protein PKH65_04910 [Bacteroidia bacterium]|nr:hypothetical protein [Bacteroidia bacterium]HNT80002.1 hypothetical protein [Bacteroidia bacterium]
MITLNRIGLLLLCSTLVATLFYACKKDDSIENPYDNVNYNTDTSTVTNPSDTSLAGIYKNIFNPKCNVPGCHDGTFEPDFRTIQSSFSTLVYQPVIKTTVNGVDSFVYRVIPFDTTLSFLHERITTTTSDYMPSNAVRLSSKEIQNINKWILNGAPDGNGFIASPPDLLPNIIGFIATDSAFNRIDTIRLNNLAYNPFIVQHGQTINFYFLIEDDHTPIVALQNNQLKFSIYKDVFSSAVNVNANYMNFGGTELYTAQINSSLWAYNDTVYFRYYVNDGINLSNSEYPRNETNSIIKTVFSFINQ